ncbi:MAG: hypothetical protein DRR16_03160 [Candidatus Parabeggiatoa sp. nov. 3]|nr:MAG: hypothetical protein DRR00_01020 [Gammaproteobacteria bacterium]RKZ66822.1 MAG: hypothetical protein DRQ99_08500 [Gammaproteobacteria bacterium]RKZ89164.1 MAG: hypothetical protein DRR16_03160 [Gammaproteobacteria bacterium]
MGKNTKRKLPKKLIKQELNELSVRANKKEVKILGLVSEEIEANAKVPNMNPYVALKYFKSDWQCFSDWESQELKEFSSFLEVLSKHTWQQVYNTGSKIPKHGLAYTKYEIDEVKSEAIKSRLKSVEKEISEDINFFELRVNQDKLRVHGFQSQSAFFLVVLDRNHEVFPM